MVDVLVLYITATLTLVCGNRMRNRQNAYIVIHAHKEQGHFHMYVHKNVGASFPKKIAAFNTHTHTHTHAMHTRWQAAEYYKKAAEDAAQKAKEGVEGAASQGGELVKVDGANIESPGWLTNMWESAQKAAQEAQKAAMEVRAPALAWALAYANLRIVLSCISRFASGLMSVCACVQCAGRIIMYVVTQMRFALRLAGCGAG
jgi:hypothetical protein